MEACRVGQCEVAPFSAALVVEELAFLVRIVSEQN
jgi:hypothetical protein